mmetsp:Transcript_7788/g.20230  ORF Transcript_7788/g.20230 Transcript_7788/m.20230 type:complete len:266 (+) Transcript_7788:32-829(+)
MDDWMIATPSRGVAMEGPHVSIDSIRRECLERLKRDPRACLEGPQVALSWQSKVTLAKRARDVLDDVLAESNAKRMRRTGVDADDAPAMDEVRHRPAQEADEDSAGFISPDDEAALIEELEAELSMLKAEVLETEAASYARDLELEAQCIEQLGQEYDEESNTQTATGQASLVLCPVCRVGWLGHRRRHDFRSFFECSKCATRIADAEDGLGLMHFRTMLAQALEEHRLSGCDATPAFVTGPYFDGDFAILMCRCASCSFHTALM